MTGIDLNTNAVDQLGVIVSDLDAAVSGLKELLNVTDIEVMDYPPPGFDPQTYYLGEKVDFKLRIAFFRIGSLQFEVIQPVCGKSIFKDFLDAGHKGLHHMRFTVPDLKAVEEEFKTKGVKMIADGCGAHGHSHWAFFDTTGEIDGLLIEVRQK